VEFQLLYEVGEFELENSLPQAHRSKLPRLHLLYKSVGRGGGGGRTKNKKKNKK